MPEHKRPDNNHTLHLRRDSAEVSLAAENSMQPSPVRWLQTGQNILIPGKRQSKRCPLTDKADCTLQCSKWHGVYVAARLLTDDSGRN